MFVTAESDLIAGSDISRTSKTHFFECAFPLRQKNQICTLLSHLFCDCLTYASRGACSSKHT